VRIRLLISHQQYRLTLVLSASCRVLRDIAGFLLRRATPLYSTQILGCSPWTRLPMFGSEKQPSPQRNWGPKTCKLRRDFRQLQSSIANISGTGQDIQNRKGTWSPAIPPAFYEKSRVNFGPLTTENGMWVWTHPNCIFRETISRPLVGADPSNFNMH